MGYELISQCEFKDKAKHVERNDRERDPWESGWTPGRVAEWDYGGQNGSVSAC